MMSEDTPEDIARQMASDADGDADFLQQYIVNPDNPRLPPDLERMVMVEPGWALDYATNIIKGRWPEAEPYILQELHTAYWYAINVVKDRWPEAEPIIAEDPTLALMYNCSFIKHRWPEAEQYFDPRGKDAHIIGLYIDRFKAEIEADQKDPNHKRTKVDEMFEHYDEWNNFKARWGVV